MRYILGCDEENRILDMLKSLDWFCIELFLKIRIFLFFHKIRMGLIELDDKEIMKIMIKRIELKYSEDNEVDRIIYLKGVSDRLYDFWM